MPRPEARRRLSRLRPSSSGRPRSRMAAAYWVLARASSAWAAEVMTSAAKPLASRAEISRPASSRLSSTTSSRIGPVPGSNHPRRLSRSTYGGLTLNRSARFVGPNDAPGASALPPGGPGRHVAEVGGLACSSTALVSGRWCGQLCSWPWPPSRPWPSTPASTAIWRSAAARPACPPSRSAPPRPWSRPSTATSPRGWTTPRPWPARRPSTPRPAATCASSKRSPGAPANGTPTGWRWCC